MLIEAWQVAPVLVVRDLAISIPYWRDRMGFAVIGTFRDPPVMAFMGRSGVQFMLQGNGDNPIPGTNRGYMDGVWDAHVWIEDADALHADMKARGAQVSDLCDTFYNNREFEVTDPDGYIIAFGSQVRRD
ncbi:MAG: VOC family protein [Sphingomonas sp.]|jgi:uncharacterized glyoxalase superfamily protein PhnB|uniref:VOC family protein n=1 Tax=Sphingomonas sp. TaxID=28214 RepID=UPI003563D10B